MKVLYSDILPLGISDQQETVSDRICEEISSSDAVEIAVGYASKASLLELDRMVEEHHPRYGEFAKMDDHKLDNCPNRNYFKKSCDILPFRTHYIYRGVSKRSQRV